MLISPLFIYMKNCCIIYLSIEKGIIFTYTTPFQSVFCPKETITVQNESIRVGSVHIPLFIKNCYNKTKTVQYIFFN